MGLHLDVDIEIARRPAHRSRLSLAAQTELHAVVDAGGNFHLELRALHLGSRPAAVDTLFTDDLPAPLTGRTRCLHAEESLRVDDSAAAAAIVARLWLGGGARRAASAGRTRFPTSDFESPLATVGSFEQIDGDRAAQMAATMGTAAAPLPFAEHAETF